MDHKTHHIIEHASRYLIIASVITFTLETHPGFKEYQHIFHILEIFFVTVFTGEYLFRVWKASDRKGFIFSFYGLVDLFAILPFYLSIGFADLRWVRALRVMRVFRIFKLGRYITAVDRIRLAFYNIKEELGVFSVISMLVIYLAAVGVYYFEKDAQPDKFVSILHSLWWALVSLTTVGYGDVFPVTTGGRFFTGIILLIGLGLISIPSGLLASSFSDVMRAERERKE